MAINHEKKLLFIGAITPTKGFVELMQIWSSLAQSSADLQLVVAGSIGVHQDVPVGPLGVAEKAFEVQSIIPWLENLPETHRPTFLGGVGPLQLREEIARSWAVIVNPSWQSWETFCVSAVEAQACNRTVFSISKGGLQETVYQGSLPTLSTSKAPEALGHLISTALLDPKAVEENGILAGEYIRKKFGAQQICDDWLTILDKVGSKNRSEAGRTWLDNRVCDLIRWTGAGISIEKTLRGRH